MDRDIQPRTVPEILDAAFRLYRRHFALLLGLSFATTLPLRDSNPQLRSLSDVGPVVGAVLITVLLTVLKGWLVTAALTDALLGQGASLTATFGRFLPALPGLIIRGACFFILVGLGTLALLVPGILLFLAWVFYSEVAIVEGRGVPAFRRSADLTKGHRGRLGILITASSLLMFALAWGVQSLGPAVHWPIASSVFAYLAGLFLGPIPPAVLLVAYFDLRARKEGLDLRLRSEALGRATTSSEVAAT